MGKSYHQVCAFFNSLGSLSSLGLLWMLFMWKSFIYKGLWTIVDTKSKCLNVDNYPYCEECGRKAFAQRKKAKSAQNLLAKVRFP